jgi:hypothetical protein
METMGRRQQVTALLSAEAELAARRQLLHITLQAQADALRKLGPVPLLGVGMLSGILVHRVSLLLAGSRIGSLPLLSGLRLWRALVQLRTGMGPADSAT